MGDLRRFTGAARRSRVAGLVVSGAAVAVVPAALLAAGPAASAEEAPAAARPRALAEVVSALLEGALPRLIGSTTTTTIDPALAAGPAEVAEPSAPAPAELRLALPVAPPPPPPPPAPPPPAPAPDVQASYVQASNVQTGVASWYNDRDGRCAHRTAPIGTVVTVTNLDDGTVVRCTVTNRGPYAPGRIIDLSDESFARIAPLSQGLADVRVEW